MLGLKVAFFALALLGHAALWVGVVNRWHAVGYSRLVTKSVTLIFYACLAAPFAVAAWYAARHGFAAESWQPTSTVTAYLAMCAVVGAMHLVVWCRRRFFRNQLAHLVRPLGQRVVDIAGQLGREPGYGPRMAVFGRVPGNQLWKLHVREFEVQIPGLPASLDGFTIAHLSDLHLSGRIDRGYYREVVGITNELAVDVVALTGDLCDKARCIDWFSEVFSDTRARLEKYFILGNHDLRTRDLAALRAAAAKAGFIDLGGRVEVIADRQLVLAGNERPWLPAAPADRELEELPAGAVRILLAHTPDQLSWARARRFDLMLAGHTHGGQVCFPIVGPVLCPSWHGMRYVSGFYSAEPTLLHVSCGTASLFPLRWGCPPEITRLVLRAAMRDVGSSPAG
jgi:predicted MPP superfamily phosphohydrolase